MTTCFVIGPIGEAGSPIRAAADDFMEYIVTPVVTSQEFGYTAIRADSLNEPGRITSQIIKLLMNAELVVADLTTNNANVFYELSLRHAIGKPVVHMAHDGTLLSFDVRDNRTIFYTQHSRRAEAARQELTNQIRHVRQPNYKPMNPILEAMTILGFERSDVPEQRAIGQLMERIEQVNSAVSEIQQQMRMETARSSATPANLNALKDPIYPWSLLNSVDSNTLAQAAKLAETPGVSAIARALAIDPNYNALSGTPPSDETRRNALSVNSTPLASAPSRT